MKRLASTALVLAATFGWLAALFALDPFERANAALDRAFGALPAWTQVENMYRDPSTQELSRGDRPLESFRELARAWAAHPGDARFILMGNSQSLMTSLAVGEPPPAAPEKTYTDLIADSYRQSGAPKLFYRLSAGALSYEEMLWYTAWLLSRPEIQPDVLLVQLNYQNFANGGIRGGMLSLLDDAAFRRAAEELARRDRPYAGSLVEALHRYEELRRASAAVPRVETGASRGERLETAVRAGLAGRPGFDRRAPFKESFVFMLYRLRTYVLHLAPSSRRSLKGARVEAGRAALEDLAAMCRGTRTRVVLFCAPTNPAVPLYGTPEDERSYRAFIAGVAARFGIPVLDFEHSIPGRYWGMALNVPDPLHLSREGHRLMARLMLEALRRNGL